MSGFIISKFQKRLLSAAVLAPLSLFVIFYGGWPFVIFVLAWAVVAFYEWCYLAMKTRHKFFFTVFGIFYVFICFWCCYWLGVWPHVYIPLLFICMVWASDIGAYFTGKTFGGPKMAATISPNKTWSGYTGAMACPVLLCLLFFIFGPDFKGGVSLTATEIKISLLAGLAIGVVGQAGDLVISLLKRQAGVKDSGQIIPGHGGVLDRVDALMLAAPVFLYIVTKYSHVFTS